MQFTPETIWITLTKDVSSTTSYTKVPGGFLYRTLTTSGGVSLVFVPHTRVRPKQRVLKGEG